MNTAPGYDRERAGAAPESKSRVASARALQGGHVVGDLIKSFKHAFPDRDGGAAAAAGLAVSRNESHRASDSVAHDPRQASFASTSYTSREAHRVGALSRESEATSPRAARATAPDSFGSPPNKGLLSDGGRGAGFLPSISRAPEAKAGDLRVRALRTAEAADCTLASAPPVGRDPSLLNCALRTVGEMDSSARDPLELGPRTAGRAPDRPGPPGLREPTTPGRLGQLTARVSDAAPFSDSCLQSSLSQDDSCSVQPCGRSGSTGTDDLPQARHTLSLSEISDGSLAPAMHTSRLKALIHGTPVAGGPGGGPANISSSASSTPAGPGVRFQRGTRQKTAAAGSPSSSVHRKSHSVGANKRGLLTGRRARLGEDSVDSVPGSASQSLHSGTPLSSSLHNGASASLLRGLQDGSSGGRVRHGGAGAALRTGNGDSDLALRGTPSTEAQAAAEVDPLDETAVARASDGITDQDEQALQSIKGFEDLTSMELFYEGQVTALYLAVPKAAPYMHVVVKVCHKAGLPKKMNSQIQLECRLLQQIQHPHMIKFLALFEDAGYICIVMEYCSGGSLARWFSRRRQQGKLAVSEPIAATRVAGPLLNVLAKLHSAGVAHRDVKLENLTFAGRALKLIDFGLAIDMAVETKAQEVGTLCYMAPELLGEELSSSCQSDRLDVWSTGVVLWILLCGKQPFQMSTQSSTRHAITALPPPWDEVAHLTDACKDFLACCLQKDPDKRPSSQELLYHEWLLLNEALPTELGLSQYL